jgi:hypothetical protein
MDAIIHRGANYPRFSNSSTIMNLCPSVPYPPAKMVDKAMRENQILLFVQRQFWPKWIQKKFGGKWWVPPYLYGSSLVCPPDHLLTQNYPGGRSVEFLRMVSTEICRQDIPYRFGACVSGTWSLKTVHLKLFCWPIMSVFTQLFTETMLNRNQLFKWYQLA